MTRADLALLGRTVVHLRPGQVAHRARLRAQQACLRRFPEAGRRVLSGPDPSAAVGWPDAFRPVDARTPGRWPGLPELRAGKIRLLGLVRELGDPPGWQHADAPRLWRFHLHYWDWAWGLAADPDRLAARALFARLWRSWQASAGFGHGDAWHPYPAALRAWSWCGLHRDLAAGSDIEPDFVAGLAAHAGFLRRHLEYDVGGNHLIKGLKALAGLAVFFADERLLRLAAAAAGRAADPAGPGRRRPLRARARLSLPGAGRPHRRGGPAAGRRDGLRPTRYPQPSTACGAGWARCSPPTARCRCSTMATRSSRELLAALRPGPVTRTARCSCSRRPGWYGPWPAAGTCSPTSARRARRRCPPTRTPTPSAAWCTWTRSRC